MGFSTPLPYSLLICTSQFTNLSLVQNTALIEVNDVPNSFLANSTFTNLTIESSNVLFTHDFLSAYGDSIFTQNILNYYPQYLWTMNNLDLNNSFFGALQIPNNDLFQFDLIPINFLFPSRVYNNTFQLITANESQVLYAEDSPLVQWMFIVDTNLFQQYSSYSF